MPKRLQLLLPFAVAIALAAGGGTVALGADTSASANVGRDIAANCANCHGTDGRSRGAIPPIAGQDKAYLVQQLKDFRDGKRPSTIMQQLAKGYTDEQIEAAAAYLASRKPN
jgi:cytochrome c553